MIRRRTTAPPGVSNRSQEPVAATRTGDAGSDPPSNPNPDSANRQRSGIRTGGPVGAGSTAAVPSSSAADGP